jgi:hypothetical protein
MEIGVHAYKRNQNMHVSGLSQSEFLIRYQLHGVAISYVGMKPTSGGMCYGGHVLLAANIALVHTLHLVANSTLDQLYIHMERTYPSAPEFNTSSSISSNEGGTFVVVVIVLIVVTVVECKPWTDDDASTVSSSFFSISMEE